MSNEKRDNPDANRDPITGTSARSSTGSRDA